MGRIFLLLIVLILLLGLIYTQYTSSSVSSSALSAGMQPSSTSFPQSGSMADKVQYFIDQRTSVFLFIRSVIRNQSEMAKEIIRQIRK